jgi:hypothetical protein
MQTMNGSTMNTKELMAQLAELDKKIFEQAIIENKGRVKMNTSIKALDNLEVDAIQNQKYIDRIISVNAMIDYRLNGGTVTVCKPRGIAKSAKTWAPIKGSIFSMGAKAVNLNQVGLNVRSHG